MQIHTTTIFFALLSTFSWIVLSYGGGYAEEKSWPVWRMFAADTSLLKIMAFIALLVSLVGGGYLAEWWSGIVAVFVGLLLGVFLIKLLRQYVQPLAFIGLVLLWVLGIVVFSQNSAIAEIILRCEVVEKDAVTGGIIESGSVGVVVPDKSTSLSRTKIWTIADDEFEMVTVALDQNGVVTGTEEVVINRVTGDLRGHNNLGGSESVYIGNCELVERKF